MTNDFVFFGENLVSFFLESNLGLYLGHYSFGDSFLIYKMKGITMEEEISFKKGIRTTLLRAIVHKDGWSQPPALANSKPAIVSL